MACRHHSMELMIAVGYITIFRPSTGPEVTLFKGLQEVWNSLDPTDIDLPTLPPSLKQQKADILRFINSKIILNILKILKHYSLYPGIWCRCCENMSPT